jgi:hypothetical protein
MTFRRRGYLCLCRRCAVKDFLQRIGIRFETPFESASGLTRRPDPGYLRGGEKRETTLIQSGGGPGPAKPQQPAREGAVLIPTRATLESGPVDAPGGWLVGAQSEYPFRPPLSSEHDAGIAKFYLQRGSLRAAESRLRGLLTDYPETQATAQALDRFAKVYAARDEPEEANLVSCSCQAVPLRPPRRPR